MSEKPRLDHIRALAEKHPQMQQFGQGNDNRVHDGKTACTHTICQFLALVWNGERLTLNDVNHLAGMPNNAVAKDGKPRGMRPNELATFLERAHIPMHIKFDIPFAGLLTRSDRGPVFYGMRYGSAPTMEVHGAANGPFGFARPPGLAGATQKGIPDVRHAVLMLGFLERRGPDGKVVAVDVFRKEPNHGSPARPERPPYDRILAHQAQVEYNDYRDKLGMRLYAAVPTQSLKMTRSPTMAPTDDTGPADPNPYQVDDDEPDDDPIEPAKIGADERAHDSLPEDPDEDDLSNDAIPD